VAALESNNATMNPSFRLPRLKALLKGIIELASPPDAARQLAAELNLGGRPGQEFVAVRHVRPLAVAR
jgi:hypothetical protein